MGVARRRQAFFQAAGAAVVAPAALAAGTGAAFAHDLRPDDPLYRFDLYESIVNRHAAIKQVYQWPNLNNPIIFANVRNGLNGAQFSYGLPPEQVQVVVQAYASANAATYDDFIWNKYRWGEALNVVDPATGQPATRNIWWNSNVPPVNAPLMALERSHPLFADMSMEGLHRRGVLFLT